MRGETTDLKDVAKIANQYLVAHGKQLYTARNHDEKKPFDVETAADRPTVKCFNCGKVEHKAAECRSKKSVVVTDRDPGPGKSQPVFNDYYPSPGSFQEQTGINRDHFYKSVICSRL